MFFLATVEVHFADQTLMELWIIEGTSETCADELLTAYADQSTNLDKGYYFQAKGLKKISPENAQMLQAVAYIDKLPNVPDPSVWRFVGNIQKGEDLTELSLTHFRQGVGDKFWWGDPQNCSQPESYRGLYRHKDHT